MFLKKVSQLFKENKSQTKSDVHHPIKTTFNKLAHLFKASSLAALGRGKIDAHHRQRVNEVTFYRHFSRSLMFLSSFFPAGVLFIAKEAVPETHHPSRTAFSCSATLLFFVLNFLHFFSFALLQTPSQSSLLCPFRQFSYCCCLVLLRSYLPGQQQCLPYRLL